MFQTFFILILFYVLLSVTEFLEAVQIESRTTEMFVLFKTLSNSYYGEKF